MVGCNLNISKTKSFANGVILTLRDTRGYPQSALISQPERLWRFPREQRWPSRPAVRACPARC